MKRRFIQLAGNYLFKAATTGMVVLMSMVGSAWADTTDFTTPGEFTWTCPAGVTSVDVECWGGGGAGGTALRSPSAANAYGGGGGGGAYAKSTLTVIPGNNYTVFVGGGGIRTATLPTTSYGAPGASGTNSWFGDGSVTNVLAVGGTGGGDRSQGGNGTGGAGGAGAASTGTVVFSGGNGAAASSNGGGGGSSGGSAANGNNGAVSAGGAAVVGGGAGGAGRSGGSGSGFVGGAPGGGGGGARSGGAIQLGGNGANGKVTLTYTPAYDHINVETAADGTGTTLAATNLNIGNSIVVYAIGRAADNSFIGNAQGTWFLTNATGGVIAADLVPAGDGKSATFTAHAIGSAQIAAASGVATVNPSATVTVVAAAPANNLAWTGELSSDWDLVTFNWTNLVAGLSTNFAQLDRVLFDDTSIQTSVNVTAPVLQADVVVDTAATYTFSGTGAIGGVGSVTKTGTGILVLSTTNTYDGVTTVSNGTVQLGNAKGLGSTYSGTVIASGATLDLNGTVNAATGEAITVSGAGAGGAGAIVNNGTSLFNQSFNNAPITLTGDTTLGGSGRFDFNGGSFTGNGYKLTKAGANAVVFSNNGNTDLGDVEIQSGSLTLVGNVTLGRANSNLVVQTSTTLDFFAVNNTNALVKNIAVTNGTISTSSGTTWLNTPIVFDTALTLGGSGNTIVSNTITGGAGILTKSSAGTVTLFTANDFSGGTAINGGIIKIEKSGALGTGLVTVTAPVTSQATRIDLANGVNFTNDVVTVGRNTGFNGVIYVPGANDVATNSGSITCNSGNIPSGAGGHLCGPSGTNGMLHVLGPIIQGTDTPAIRNGFVRVYGGGSGNGFIINQGTTSLGATDGINPAASINLAASGLTVLDLNGFNQTLAGLVRGANVAVVTNSSASLSTLTLNIAADQAFTGVLAGKIALVKSGLNALTNSGANTYTGNTTVQQGILSLPNPSLARAATVTIDAGAVLDLTFSGTNAIAGLVTNGVAAASGFYNAGNSGGAITGTGTLLVAPFSTTPTNLTATVTGGTFDLSWPITHLGWIAASNSVDISNPNLWFDIAGSKDVNSLAVTIDPAKTNVFYRLRLP